MLNENAPNTVEVAGITLRPSPDQHAAWSDAAAGAPLADWLEDLADDAATAKERTWPVVIRLRYPVTIGSETTDELRLRRGCIRDLKGMKLSGEMPTEHLMTIASRLSGQTTQVIERLDQEDAGEVMAIAIDFYGACLGAGKKRSR